MYIIESKKIEPFYSDIKKNIKNEVELNQYINSFLKSKVKYDVFRKKWVSEVKTQDVEVIEEDEDSLKYIALSEDELQKKTDELQLIERKKERLESKILKIKNKKEVKMEELRVLHTKEVKQLVYPIVELYTNDTLITKIVQKYDRKIVKKYQKLIKKELDPEKLREKYDTYTKKVQLIKNIKRTELMEKKKEELIKKFIKSYKKDYLINIIIDDEFKKLEKYNNLIIKCSVKIHNLKLLIANGRIRNRLVQSKVVSTLSPKEELYKNIVVKQIKKIELEEKDIKSLQIEASRVIKRQPIELLTVSFTSYTKQELIHMILEVTFKDLNTSSLSTIRKNEFKRILQTMDEESINLLIQNPYFTYQSKNEKINYLIDEQFPVRKTKKLLNGKRKSELEHTDEIQLKTYATMLNIDILTSKEQLIEQILMKEQLNNTLIHQSIDEKNKIASQIALLTNTPIANYVNLSLSELQEEMERISENPQSERFTLLLKLSNLIQLDKYKDIHQWSMEDLHNLLTRHQSSISKNKFVTDYTVCVDNFITIINGCVGNEIENIWLIDKNGNKPAEPYIHSNIFLTTPSLIPSNENKLTWYKANNKFLSLMCNPLTCSQSDSVVTVYDNTNEVQFIVGYSIREYTKPEIDDKLDVREIKKDNYYLMIQNEFLFNLFQKNKKVKTDFEKVKIKNILYDSIGEESRELMYKELSSNLLLINPDNLDYGIPRINVSTLSYIYKTKYIEEIVKELEKNCTINKELFERVGNIIVYLRLKETVFFKATLKKHYYLPDTLANLSESDKFPELYENPTINFSSSVTIITNMINEYVYNMAELLYFNRNLVIKRTKTYESSYKPSIKIINRLENCSNVENIHPNNIIKYTEDNITYCLVITDFIDQLNQKNYINTFTGKPFRQEFIDKCLSLYNNELKKNGFLSSTFVEKYKLEMEKKDVLKPKIDIDIIPDFFTRLNTILNGYTNKSEVSLSLNSSLKCTQCKGNINKLLKSVSFINFKYTIVYFCSTTCLQKYKFKLM